MTEKVLVPVQPIAPLQFGAMRIVHFRDVTRQETMLPKKAAKEASQTLSAAIQKEMGRVPVLMTRFAPASDIADDQDWLLLTGDNVDTFLNDAGDVPDSEVDSDGMWHFLRSVAQQAQMLPPLTVDLVPWHRLTHPTRKPQSELPVNNRHVPKRDRYSPASSDRDSRNQPAFEVFNIGEVIANIKKGNPTAVI